MTARCNHPTQIRFTDEDRRRIAVIREYHDCLSLAQAVRRAIDTEFHAIPEPERLRIAARLEESAKTTTNPRRARR